MSTTENTANWWKQKAEELRLQLYLGKKEVEEKFEDEKKNIKLWADETRKDIADLSSENAKSFKTKLETLKVQAALGKAESKEALVEQETKLKKAFNEVQKEANILAEDSSEKVAEVGKNASDKIEIWQTQMDIFKLQMQLGKKEAEIEWESKKKQIKDKLNDIDKSIEEMKKEGSESIENFRTEMAKSWQHLKSAFTNS